MGRIAVPTEVYEAVTSLTWPVAAPVARSVLPTIGGPVLQVDRGPWRHTGEFRFGPDYRGRIDAVAGWLAALEDRSNFSIFFLSDMLRCVSTPAGGNRLAITTVNGAVVNIGRQGAWKPGVGEWCALANNGKLAQRRLARVRSVATTSTALALTFTPSPTQLGLTLAVGDLVIVGPETAVRVMVADESEAPLVDLRKDDGGGDGAVVLAWQEAL